MIVTRLLGLVILASALLAGGCVTSGKYPADGIVSDVLVLTDLNPKILPIDIDVDADPKDTLYKSRTKFKPATAAVFGSKDLRLLLRGKKDGAALRAELARDFFSTGYDLHVRVAFDPNKTTGLVDGTTLGFLELVLDTSMEAPPIRRLEAVYNAAFNGFTVRATDGAAPLGTPAVFGNAPDVVLRFLLDAGTLTLAGGPATGEFFDDFAPTLIHDEPLVDDGVLRQTVAWGATGLGKKGALYLNYLTLGGILPDIGAAETPIAMNMMEAFEHGFDAAFFFPPLAAAVAAVENERLRLVDVVADLETAVTQGTLGPVTQGERALKNAQKALKLATKAKAVGDKLLAKGSTKSKPVSKKALASLRTLQLAFAQLVGFRSNSKGKVARMGFLPFGF